MNLQKTLNVVFLILVGVWLFGTYRFSNNNTQTDPSYSFKTDTLPESTSTIQGIIKKTATSTLITKKKSVKLKSVAPPTTPVVTTPAVVIPTAPIVTPDFEAINTFARKAVVNILCTARGNELSPISGTGVVISQNGIILTNAHVGQYFLLRNLYQKDFIQCVVRTGSPAYPLYYAELVYISPRWVSENKGILKISNPQGTGENDFALLHITAMIDGTSLPVIPHMTPNIREVMTINKPVILVSYPAGFLGGLSILQGLSVTSGITSIKDFFTFKETTIDIISVPGTVVSQKGSSGGAVVDKDSTLIGIISTSSNENTTGARNLNAITVGYINRSLKIESGLTLLDYLSGDINSLAQDFQNNTAPKLIKIITDELTKIN